MYFSVLLLTKTTTAFAAFYMCTGRGFFFCMLRRCFSVSNNLCITSELESPGILDGIWKGGVAKEHMPTLYVIWIRNLILRAASVLTAC